MERCTCGSNDAVFDTRTASYRGILHSTPEPTARACTQRVTHCQYLTIEVKPICDTMCERRSRKIKKGSRAARLRETRRAQRLHRLVSPAVTVAGVPEPAPCPGPPLDDKAAQNRLIIELALKTISLMQKNSLIQQKIIALKKETSEFVASVMSNPENKRRYLEHLNVYGSFQVTQVQTQQCTIIKNIL